MSPAFGQQTAVGFRARRPLFWPSVKLKTMMFWLLTPFASCALGWRIGKGEGYADMEYAMMVSMGAVTEDTPVITIVHDCQVSLKYPLLNDRLELSSSEWCIWKRGLELFWCSTYALLPLSLTDFCMLQDSRIVCNFTESVLNKSLVSCR